MLATIQFLKIFRSALIPRGVRCFTSFVIGYSDVYMIRSRENLYSLWFVWQFFSEIFSLANEGLRTQNPVNKDLRTQVTNRGQRMS